MLKTLFNYLFVFCFIFSALPDEAQQTIFNVPSADIAQKREIFLQHESQFNPILVVMQSALSEALNNQLLKSSA